MAEQEFGLRPTFRAVAPRTNFNGARINLGNERNLRVFLLAQARLLFPTSS